MLNKAIEAITAQQPKQRNDVWMVGEQLKDLLRAEPQWAEMVLQDLGNKDQSLAAVAQKIRDLANKNRNGSFGCVTPAEADHIIRTVYGIPKREERPAAPSNVINLEDYF